MVPNGVPAVLLPRAGTSAAGGPMNRQRRARTIMRPDECCWPGREHGEAGELLGARVVTCECMDPQTIDWGKVRVTDFAQGNGVVDAVNEGRPDAAPARKSELTSEETQNDASR